MGKLLCFLEKLKNLFKNVLLPPSCLYCRKKLTDDSQGLICLECWQKIEINSGFFCPECGRRLYQPQKTCHLKVPFILAAVGFYQNKVLRSLLQALKYKGAKEAAGILASLMILYFQKSKLENFLKEKQFVLLSLPLHPAKKRRRGFNQSEILAQALVKRTKNFFLPLETKALVKIKNNAPQMELKNFEARKENVKNCFLVAKPELIKGKNILLLDDVFTSGATMSEAVRVLKASGAKKIIGLVVAKA